MLIIFTAFLKCMGCKCSISEFKKLCKDLKLLKHESKLEDKENSKLLGKTNSEKGDKGIQTKTDKDDNESIQTETEASKPVDNYKELMHAINCLNETVNERFNNLENLYKAQRSRDIANSWKHLVGLHKDPYKGMPELKDKIETLLDHVINADARRAIGECRIQDMQLKLEGLRSKVNEMLDKQETFNTILVPFIQNKLLKRQESLVTKEQEDLSNDETNIEYLTSRLSEYYSKLQEENVEEQINYERAQNTTTDLVKKMSIIKRTAENKEELESARRALDQTNEIVLKIYQAMNLKSTKQDINADIKVTSRSIESDIHHLNQNLNQVFENIKNQDDLIKKEKELINELKNVNNKLIMTQKEMQNLKKQLEDSKSEVNELRKNHKEKSASQRNLISELTEKLRQACDERTSLEEKLRKYDSENYSAKKD